MSTLWSRWNSGGFQLHQDQVKNSHAGGWKAVRRMDFEKGEPVVDQSQWVVHFTFCACVLPG